MKKILVILLSSFALVMALVLNIGAASVSFNPSIVSLKVAPGNSAKANLAVHGFSDGPYSLNLSIGSRMENGNIPTGWIRSAYLMLVSMTGGASLSSMELFVSTPPDAVPGIYSGLIIPQAMRSREPISSQGISVIIEVVDPWVECSGPPVFSDITIFPESCWAPTDRDVELEISGSVSVVSGCQVTAGYTLESNNGFAQGDIVLNHDGSFHKKLKSNISRSGKDKHGKVFNGTLSAIDEEGNYAFREFSITVLHVKGQKSNSDK